MSALDHALGTAGANEVRRIAREEARKEIAAALRSVANPKGWGDIGPRDTRDLMHVFAIVADRLEAG